MKNIIQMKRNEFSLFTNFFVPENSTEEQIEHTLEKLGADTIVKQLVALRNSKPGPYDVVMCMLAGQTLRARHILLGYVGHLYSGRLELTNNAPRTSGLERVGLVKEVERAAAYKELGITDDTTVYDTLNILKTDAAKATSVFKGTSEFKKGIIFVCDELQKIYS